jgi:hypothetical protein
MAKKHLTLQPSESVVVEAAAQIYSAHIAAGNVGEDRDEWMKRSILDAIKIARGVDDAMVSDNEMS